MWNTAKWEISESDIRAEHMRVLEQAVADAEEFPVCGRDVHKALDYFTARVDRQGGINLFLRGMQENRIDYLKEGLALLKKHLGGSGK